MPSKSRASYQQKYKQDVSALTKEIEIKEDEHLKKNKDGRGKRGYGHLGRSAVVMLCASLESYIENIMKEVIDGHYISTIEDAAHLPDSVKKMICNKLAKEDMLLLSGDGWKRVYADIFEKEVFSDYGFSTPKADKINKWALKFIGIEPMNNYIRNKDLNDFIAVRGNIAHQGIKAGYIGKHDVDWYIELIDDVVLHIDTVTGEHLKNFLNMNKKPWRNT